MPYDSLTALDTLLAGPDAAGLFGHAETTALDRREDFPAEACAALDAFGLPSHYVDARHGGLLREMPELAALQRAVARHDLTIAVAHGKTFLGAVPVWLAGSPAQAARLAEDVRRGAVVSWALTERDHGGDLMAGEVTARPAPGGGWRLDGEKWLINNAGRSRHICLLARTGEQGGPRGFSLFLVDKARLAPASYRALPKVRTHGIRGADISGIAFDGAVVRDDALIGAAGTGIDTVLRSLQLTRILHRAVPRRPRPRAGHRRALRPRPQPSSTRRLRGADRLSGLLGAAFYLREGPAARFQKLRGTSSPSDSGTPPAPPATSPAAPGGRGTRPRPRCSRRGRSCPRWTSARSR
ncbi:hypothetical protein SGLAM104S_00265 [Streptomyces glaucescens]